MAQSFSLANMVPQNIQHNSGAWAKIEQDTRRYVLRAQGDVFVITGPIFTRESERIGPHGVKVPTSFTLLKGGDPFVRDEELEIALEVIGKDQYLIASGLGGSGLDLLQPACIYAG